MSLGCPTCGSLITDKHEPNCTRDEDTRRRKLIADLRAMSQGRSHTETIIGIAADELEAAWAALKGRSIENRNYLAGLALDCLNQQFGAHEKP